MSNKMRLAPLRGILRFYEPQSDEEEEILNAMAHAVFEHSQLPMRSTMVLMLMTLHVTDLERRVGRISLDQIAFGMRWKTRRTTRKHLNLVIQSGEVVVLDDADGEIHYYLPPLPVEWPAEIKHLAHVREPMPEEE